MDSSTNNGQVDSEKEPASIGQDSSSKLDSKEELEERCNKLKRYALTLKKKVYDLTEELKTSEAEKIKLIAEKENFQKKISQASDNLKQLQAIQLEYDKLQDDLDKQKNENKKLTKNLEMLIVNNTSLKQTNYELKDTIASLNLDLENRNKELSELKNILKKKNSLMKKLEDEQKATKVICDQKEKDYETMKVKLESEIQSHKATQAKLDAAKQECSSNNVILLEVDNYEKSIQDLKSKLNDESTKCKTLENTIEEHVQRISSLEFQLSELKDSLFLKTNQLTILGEKNESLKVELNDLRQEITQTSHEKQSLLDAIEAMKKNMDKLSNESTTSVAEKNKLVDDMELQNKMHLQQIEQLKMEISRLNSIISSTNEEITTLKTEYEGYKLRAQSVLRTKQSQSKDSGLNGKNIIEIEGELNHLRSHSTQLQEKLDISCQEIKTLISEVTLIKEQRDFAQENAKDLGKKLATLNQDYLSLKDKCRTQVTIINQLKEQMESSEEMLKENFTVQLASIEHKYQQEISSLHDEIERLTSTTVSGNIKNLSEKQSEYKFENDNQIRNDIYLLKREDGEGSESVDSYNGANVNVEKNQKSTLIPLDELLNSSDDLTKFNTPVLPAKVDRHELEVAERRIKHLTTLLADAERDVAKLNQMNQLLKEDIRRQQRSVEREHHANNFEYLKNVVLKFIILKNGDERSRLIPVLNTILKLSPEETQQLNQVAGITGRGWLPSISIPGWSHE
ncbi:GRIP and coiled-coil domain-containing protein 2-like [Chelonus insularis]|uniref:GRIP and coiled-coil domain-containing protein 2-like n=1 Tax=Chelonus insularis TaxID=460826 RepID=UPI00158BE469|nr:GRIP and coiled-coil domain-containing protein 2-like [Chelonus insularis]